MALFNKVHQKRLNKLIRAILRQGSYDQDRTKFKCGSPACIMGFCDAIFGPRVYTNSGYSYKRMIFGDPPNDNPAAYDVWSRDVTSCFGCNNAGRSGKKAVKFLRQMASDLKAALAA